VCIAITRDAQSAQARRSCGRIEDRARTPGSQQRAKAFGLVSTCVGSSSGEDQGTHPASFCRQEGSRDTETPVGGLSKAAAAESGRVSAQVVL
ncbi:MAG TPA: hypothetical protein VMS40_23195, partial [Vicinamibacterales bacterium]|nr:hypothetical protein [Vicinamibacterales bacterium]